MLAGLDDYDLDHATDTSELVAKAQAFSDTLGCGNFAYILLRPPNGKSDKEEYFATNYPTEWVSRYTERNYKLYDPIAKLYSHNRLPFVWGNKGFIGRFKKSERAILHEARAFNLIEGYAIPTAGPEGDFGGFLVCFNIADATFDAVMKQRAQLQLFAAQFHAAAIRIQFGADTKIAPKLSPRELEVLKWASSGYSSEATANKLGLTSPTINYHIANCCRKLGASNKIQAAVLAVRKNLI